MKRVQMIALATLLLLCSCHNRKPVKSGLEGKPLPAFSLMKTDSINYFSSQNLPADKPIVLFYFSTTCPYCRAQLKSIRSKMKELGGIEFVVATDEPFIALKKFCTENDIGQFKNVTIGIDTGRFLSSYFKTTAIPYTAIYAKNKILTHAFLGNMDASQIKAVAQQ